MHRLLEDLIIFSEGDPMLKKVADLVKRTESDEYSGLKREAHSIVRYIVQMSEIYGFSGNLWHSYVAYYIALDENPFSLAYERNRECKSKDSLALMAKSDCKALRRIFDYDFSHAEEKWGDDCFSEISHFQGSCKRISDMGIIIEKFKAALEKTKNDEEFFEVVEQFYREQGAGILGLNKAFTVRTGDGEIEFLPVKSMEDIRLSDLIGYEIQKKKLVDNTEAFLNKKPSNNVLLYGDGGTGKSTGIRAIANQYASSGLRLIQVYRHQMQYLKEIASEIKDRNYRFIIYMDDLSFEDFETEYKYLKAVIEGGLEPKPENVLIYATSNRRHLIKETWNDRSDMEHTGELHRSDSVEEKLSLSERFGIQIYYAKPSVEEFHQIVETLALRENVKTDLETLHKEATKWEIRRGGVSGRSARQFIDYIKGTED